MVSRINKERKKLEIFVDDEFMELGTTLVTTLVTTSVRILVYF